MTVETTQPDPLQPDPLQIVLDLLNVERLEVDLFRGISPDETSQRVFGGQVIGQAMMAAYQTVEDRVCHSCLLYTSPSPRDRG